jgi:hypothetical protein
MTSIRTRRKKPRKSRARSHNRSLKGFNRVLITAGRGVSRLTALVSRILFRARGFVALLVSLFAIGASFLIVKEKIMDKLAEALPQSVEITSNNTALRGILEPLVIERLQQAEQKKWTRQKFNDSITQLLESEKAVLGAVLRYHLGKKLSITITAHTPSFNLSDASGASYIFDPTRELIGKAPIRGLQPAQFLFTLKNDVVKVQAGKAKIKSGPVASALHKAQVIYQRLAAASLRISGSVALDSDLGFSVCARIDQMPPTSCLRVALGHSLPSPESLNYLAQQLKEITTNTKESWPESIDLTLNDRVLVRRPASQMEQISSSSSAKAE